MKSSGSIGIALLLITTSILLVAFDLPQGWIRAGSKYKSYDMGVDPGSGRDGKNAATIKSIDKKINGFGTLMQSSSPANYLGKRVRMSGYMKTMDVANWAGLWFRIDQKDSDKRLGFDNMRNGKVDRSIKGTTDWTRYEIVLDVPVNAHNLAYGALLNGTGQIWFDDIRFEIVDSTIATTGKPLQQVEPSNLDFEK